MTPRYLKQALIRTASTFGADRFFRLINRKKLLVVMYHGVTDTTYSPPIWTQLPLEKFQRQLEFLHAHYQLIPLHDVIAASNGHNPLPERAALVTFDDGLSNNYSCAFPVLRQLNIPAAIFLTVDLIGTKQLLWFDELFFLLQEALSAGITPELDSPKATELLGRKQLWMAYQLLVEELKGADTERRRQVMARLKAHIPLDCTPLRKDFGMLTWDEVRQMHRSGLVEFGVHTATHRILTGLGEHEWEQEVTAPRQLLEKELQSKATAFCFPNGRPGIDFNTAHLAGLRKAGYACSFSTHNGLYDWFKDDRMSISRVPAGNDGTSDPACFALNTSGALQFMKTVTGARL